MPENITKQQNTSILSDHDLETYLLKIIPDFSIFNVLEEYYTLNNLSDGWFNFDLFYVNTNILATSFSFSDLYRCLFRSNKKMAISGDSVFSYQFNINGSYYLVIIDIDKTEKNKTLTFEEIPDYLEGVVF